MKCNVMGHTWVTQDAYGAEVTLMSRTDICFILRNKKKNILYSIWLRNTAHVLGEFKDRFPFIEVNHLRLADGSPSRASQTCFCYCGLCHDKQCRP